MKITFFDLETTDKSAVNGEIITAYFTTIKDFNYERSIDSLDIKLKPHTWKEEAAQIHGITREEAFNFPDRLQGLRAIYSYLKRHVDGYFCCHANAHIFGRHGHFDWLSIANNMAQISDKAYFAFNNEFGQAKVISTHTMAKKLVSLNSYKLTELAKNFNYQYKAHDAKEDVWAMIHVFKELTQKLNQNDWQNLYDLGHYSGTLNWDKYRVDQNYLPLEGL